jgi:hypothetical protein
MWVSWRPLHQLDPVAIDPWAATSCSVLDGSWMTPSEKTIRRRLGASCSGRPDTPS